MRTNKGKSSLLAVAVFLVAACVHTGAGPIKSAGERGGKATDLAAGLARGYRLLSEYELSVTRDLAAAARFGDKAARVQSGDLVGPDPLTAADGDELAKARGRLLEIRQDDDLVGEHALQIAQAQINFDCWAYRVRRRYESAGGCHARFEEAMRALPAQGKIYAVYFDSGKEVPDQDAFAIIRKAAAAFEGREGWRIHLTGYADGKGKKNQNLMLSLRRTLAVRNALVQNGVDINHIVVDAEGASPKGSVGSDISRRVDIALVPEDQDKPGSGPDIRKIAPQYFNADEVDF